MPATRRAWAILALALALVVPDPVVAAQQAGARSGASSSREGGAATVEHTPQTRPKRRGSQSRVRRSPRRAPVAAAPAPRWTAPRGSAALASDLGSMLSGHTRSGEWGAIVVSLTRGDTLYSYRPDAALQPASTMKLFTAVLALDQFGPAHQFSTDVLRDGPVLPDGTLAGNLVLRGDGDPSLSSRFVHGGPGAPMILLAERVAASGIRHVRGDLVADATAFDGQRIPDGWQSRYLHASYAARVSALSLNENLAWVVVQPGRAGTPAAAALEPASDLPLVNRARTVAGSGTRIVVLPRPEGQIEVRGWIGARAGVQRYQVVVEDPAAFTAGAFRRALAERGVTVAGAVRYGQAPDSAVTVASLPSQPMSRLLAIMNRESVNHYAELLFRDAGRRASPTRVGSIETASRLLDQVLTEKVGVAPGAVYAADGSGLSVLDRATPRSLVQLLSYSHRAPWSDAFHASLPVAGESELLRHRMRFTPAQGNLHAKTGTTNTVISLAGYVTAENGELLGFAFIYNGTDRWNARSTIDQMGPTLASFVRD